MQPIEQAIQLKTELDNLRPLTKEQEAIIMQKFRLDWNYNSNNLEGNSLTYGETKALLLHGITAQGKPLKDHFEITGHDEAIKWVEDLVKRDHPLTENFIRELHTLLLKSPYEVKAITPDGQPTTRRIAVGQYKTAPNHVKTKTGEIFRFATPEETPAKMHDLIQWYRKKNEELDVNPILLAAEFHYRFIRIHPFDDGNGRTVRILMNFILMKFNYPPVIIKTEDKDNYFFALQQADAGTIEPFINYIATNLVRSLEIMIAGAKGESIEEPDDIDKEIALLEQRLKTNGNKLEITRTEKVLIELYDDSITRLWNKFLQACGKFDRFYLKVDSKLYVNHFQRSTQPNALAEMRDKINADVEMMLLEYTYDGFNRSGFNQFQHKSIIQIDLPLTHGYSVSVVSDDYLLNKLYGEQLSESEISSIANLISRNHKDYIDHRVRDEN
ncbi:Fic family protein [Parapedobacter indicus]|uniref:Fic family protein n=1 Tax=Parapedobacter indicus TaxID=1477437 RepID=A0A1I3ISM1_9SPHI|nr:Fic family protein [Parapedobacter indicus]PPL02277.1 Fic family protein [Parapedobacter indicus]SFI50945.1 Fic family protein [Parapedobacter indicus]